MPQDIARSLSDSGEISNVFFRALVKPVKAYEGGGKNRFARGTLELSVERLELIVVDRSPIVPGLHLDVIDKDKIVWSYKPPSYSSIAAKEADKRARDNKEIAELEKECAVVKGNPTKCYNKLCSKIKKTGDVERSRACHAESTAAYKKWVAADSASRQTTRKAEEEALRRKRAMEIVCRRRFSGSKAQSWMPVEGTSAYKAAMDACMSEPDRDEYGPDILGLRLGMPLTEADGFIKRQSINFSANSTDSRPFEKATLYWTEDSNHGIALFSVVNGEHERVAAVSRRLYMGDKKLTSAHVTGGLRKKYGKELWSSGNTLLWASNEGGNKPSANKCSGLAELVEPRTEWNRPWGDGNRRARASSRRRAEAMNKVAPQQECMAKHGMPTGPEDMQKLAQCVQELAMKAGAGAPSLSARSTGKSESGTRLPFMVKPTGTSKLFAAYESCGVVTIAHITTDSAGTVKDVSSVLFDPSWIARQPDYAFKSGSGEDQIDF